MKLDRYPFEPASGSFRVRPNACLKLGQGCHQRVLDGTFAVDTGVAAASLLKDRRAGLKLLAQLGLPQPVSSVDMAPDASASRVKRTARRIGYPLAISALQGGPSAREPRLVGDESALEVALETIAAWYSPILMWRPSWMPCLNQNRPCYRRRRRALCGGCFRPANPLAYRSLR